MKFYFDALKDGVSNMNAHARTDEYWGAVSPGSIIQPTLRNLNLEMSEVADIGSQRGIYFIDVHGDEELPHIFLAPEVGSPTWTDRHAELYRLLCVAQLRASPDFQVRL